jgi:hypothetical protein
MFPEPNLRAISAAQMYKAIHGQKAAALRLISLFDNDFSTYCQNTGFALY